MRGVLPPGRFQTHFSSRSVVSPCLAPRLGLCIASLQPGQLHSHCLPSSTSHHCSSRAAHPGQSPPNSISSYLGDESMMLARFWPWVPGQAGDKAQGCCNTAHCFFRCSTGLQGHRCYSPDRLQPPNHPATSLPCLAFISFHPPATALTTKPHVTKPWVLVLGCLQTTARDPRAVSQPLIHCQSLYGGVAAAGVPSRCGGPQLPPAPPVPQPHGAMLECAA